MKPKKFQCPECLAFTTFFRAIGSIEPCSHCGQKVEIISANGHARKVEDEEDKAIEPQKTLRFSPEQALQKAEADPFAMLDRSDTKKTNILAVTKRMESRVNAQNEEALRHLKQASKRKLYYGLVAVLCVVATAVFFFQSNKSNALKEVFATEQQDLSTQKSLLENPEIFDIGEQLVVDFFQSESAEEALKYVLKDPTINKTLTKYWRPRALIKEPYFSHSRVVENSNNVVLNYSIRVEGYSERLNLSVLIDENLNAYLDWKNLEGVGQIKFEDKSSLDSGEVVELRGILSPSTYYNFGYSEKNYIALDLKDYKTNQVTLYIARSKVNEEMAEFLAKLSKRPQYIYLTAEKAKGDSFEVITMLYEKPWNDYFQTFQKPYLKNQ